MKARIKSTGNIYDVNFSTACWHFDVNKDDFAALTGLPNRERGKCTIKGKWNAETNIFCGLEQGVRNGVDDREIEFIYDMPNDVKLITDTMVMVIAEKIMTVDEDLGQWYTECAVINIGEITFSATFCILSTGRCDIQALIGYDENDAEITFEKKQLDEFDNRVDAITAKYFKEANA